MTFPSLKVLMKRPWLPARPVRGALSRNVNRNIRGEEAERLGECPDWSIAPILPLRSKGDLRDPLAAGRQAAVDLPGVLKNSPGTGSMRAGTVFKRYRAAAPFPYRLILFGCTPLPATDRFLTFISGRRDKNRTANRSRRRRQCAAFNSRLNTTDGRH
jgi:hypothetical protein